MVGLELDHIFIDSLECADQLNKPGGCRVFSPADKRLRNRSHVFLACCSPTAANAPPGSTVLLGELRCPSPKRYGQSCSRRMRGAKLLQLRLKL